MGICHAFEGFGEDCAAGGEVEADEALVVGAEGGTVVEGDFGFFEKEVMYVVGVGVGAVVEEGEVGGFDVGEADVGEAGVDEVFEEGAVVAEVVKDGGEPLAVVGESGFPHGDGEGGGVSGDPCGGFDDAGDEGRVVAEHGADAETGGVVGFAWAGEGEGAFAEIFVGEVGEGGVGAFEREVGVEFVGDDVEVVAVGEVGELGEFVRGEEAAGGIVGVAEEEAFGGVVVDAADGVFKGVPVYFPAGVGEGHGGFAEVAVVVLVGEEEGRVGGGEGDDGIAGVGEAEDGGADAGDDTGEEADPVPCGEILPAAPTCALKFVAEEAEEFGVAFDVVVADGLCEAVLEGGADGGGDGEVHVGDPEREDIVGIFGPFEIVGVAERGDVEFEVGAVHFYFRVWGQAGARFWMSSQVTRRTSATDQAWAGQPRGVKGASPSAISEMEPRPTLWKWSLKGSMKAAASLRAAGVSPRTLT